MGSARPTIARCPCVRRRRRKCQLRDLAFAFVGLLAHGAKGAHVDSEDPGPIVKKRRCCIVCMRCVRYCGSNGRGDALTAHQRGAHTGAVRQPLDCEQCGNCIEVAGRRSPRCRTGSARPWDLRQHITICPHCSNGCSVRLAVRGMEVLARARHREPRREIGSSCACADVSGDLVNSPTVSASAREAGRLAPAGHGTKPRRGPRRISATSQRRTAGAITPFLGGEQLLVEEQHLMQKLARAVLGRHQPRRRPHATSRAFPGDGAARALGGGRPTLSFADFVNAQEVPVLFDDLGANRRTRRRSRSAPKPEAGQERHYLTVAPAPREAARPKFRAAGSACSRARNRARARADQAALGLGWRTCRAPISWGLEGSRSRSRRGRPSVWRARPASPPTRSRRRRSARRAADRKAVLFGRAVTEHAQAPSLLQAIENLGWVTGALTSPLQRDVRRRPLEHRRARSTPNLIA